MVRRNGQAHLEEIRPAGSARPAALSAFTFREATTQTFIRRKALGRGIVAKVLEAVEHDLDHTVTSFIPNTAESSFYGLIQGLEEHLNASKIARIKGLGANPITPKSNPFSMSGLA